MKNVFYNLHSHKQASLPEDITIISIDIRKSNCLSGFYSQGFDKQSSIHAEASACSSYYSVGIHPWYIDKKLMPDVRRLATLPIVVAIGETGLDKNTAKNQDDFSLQKEIFAEHILLSEEVKKPLIIHCVKAWDELLSIRKTTKPSMPWIIHGFRGNATLATQLLNAGLYLSFSINHNVEALKVTWNKGRLFAETDNAEINIRKVCTTIADNLGISINELLDEIEKNHYLLLGNRR